MYDRHPDLQNRPLPFLTLAVVCAVLGGFVCLPTMAAATVPASPPPQNSGPMTLVSCSWLGGPGDDHITASAVAADGTIFLAGNAGALTVPGTQPVMLGPGSMPAEPPAGGRSGHGAGSGPSAGFLIHLDRDGRKVLLLARLPVGIAVTGMQLGATGGIYMLLDGPHGLAGLASGSGTCVLHLAPDARTIAGVLVHAHIRAMALDADDSLLVLADGHLLRYAPTGGAPLWNVTWKTHGANRPGGLGMIRAKGIAVVCGYGMTRTGHEPYKDPYAYGFDRQGKQVWALWNPDPTREAASRYGGNGLMADTSGLFVASGAATACISMKADGGNTVLTRDPADPFKPIRPQVFAGVRQGTAGYGFHGASQTSVIFTVDPAGELEKGTFLSAWLSPAHANGLRMAAAATDAGGRVFLCGDSGYGCPTLLPWYVAGPDGYTGGGFLAVFTPGYVLVQCGYFPGCSLSTVAVGRHTVVVAGDAVGFLKNKSKGGTVTIAPVPSYRPLQGTYGGGRTDGFFAVLRTP